MTKFTENLFLLIKNLFVVLCLNLYCDQGQVWNAIFLKPKQERLFVIEVVPPKFS